MIAKKAFFTLLIVMLVIPTLLISPVFAQGTLFVNPPSKVDETLTPGETFTITVEVDEGIWDLWGWEFKLWYDTAVLTATLSTPNPDFPDKSVNQIDESIGLVWMAYSLPMGTEVGLDGPLWLVEIEFSVDDFGTSTLNIDDEYMFMISAAGEKIYPTILDGYFANVRYCYSCDSSETLKDIFEEGETVYVKGGLFPKESKTVDIYVVVNDEWMDGQAIGTPVNQTTTTIDENGNLPITSLGPVGFYDIVVDYNQNGYYDEETDVVDNVTNSPGIMANVHDIRIFNVAPHTTQAFVTQTVVIDVTVWNEGAFTEKEFEVKTYYRNETYEKAIEFKSTDLSPGFKILTFNWNTTMVTPGAYTIFANATVVDGEVDIADNEFIDSVVDVGHRDIRVTNVTASLTEVTKPKPVSINVTVKNEGDFTETFDVTTQYENETYLEDIGTQTGIILDAGANTTLSFTWDTTYVPATTAGIAYNISAKASELPYDLNTTNNVFADGEVTVYKPPGPYANFTYSPLSPIERETVTFNASLSTPDPKTEAPITSYAWDFGDGTTAIYVGANLTATTTHAYDEAGTYTAKLTVTDSEGLSDATMATVNIYRHNVALASVNLNQTVLILGQTLSINVTVKNEGDFSETFDVTARYDGTDIETKNVTDLVSGANTTLTFTWDTIDLSPGTYEISAVASNVTGEIETTDNTGTGGTVTILGPPVAFFTYSPTEPVEGETVAFDASASDDPDGTIESYGWDFGDGTTAIYVGANLTATTTHAYDEAGIYTVTVTVIDNDWLSDTTRHDVTVSPPHDVAITNVTASPTEVTVGDSVSISVIVENQGEFSETFDIAVKYDENLIETQTDVSLGAGATTTLNFIWDTTGVDAGNYTIIAEAILEVDNDPDDNTATGDTVTVRKAPVIPLYVVAGIAIVVVVALLLFYVLKIRKPT